MFGMVYTTLLQDRLCTLEYRQRDEANKKDNMGKIYILQEMTIIGELSEPTYMVV